MATLLIFINALAFAGENNNADANHFMGFDYEGKVINPKCVNLLQTSISDSAIITRSIIIDTCQDSNLASEGIDFSIKDDGNVSYYEDPSDGHTYFGYRVVGRTLNNVFVLFHNGYIGLYTLSKQKIRFDFSKNEPKLVTLLTKLSDTYTPCFQSAEIRGNTLIITKAVWDSSASQAAQCTNVEETLTFELDNY